MDFLSYQQRTDMYCSMGTAFVLGHNRHVTDGHVLMVGLDSRGATGIARCRRPRRCPRHDREVLAVQGLCDVLAQVSARGPRLPGACRPPAQMGGVRDRNASGTGVVIRDGRYTFQTPIQQRRHQHGALGAAIRRHAGSLHQHPDKIEHRRSPYDGVAHKDDFIMKNSTVTGPRASATPRHGSSIGSAMTTRVPSRSRR